MTARDEARAKCIEAMMSAAWDATYGHIRGTDDWRRAFTAAFDALHGIVFVEPLEATQEMRMAGKEEMPPEFDLSFGRRGLDLKSPRECVDPRSVFRAMAAAGDLTEPPEKKP